MKAAVLRRSADRRHTLLDVAEHPAPTPRPDEALVAVVWGANRLVERRYAQVFA